MKEEIKEMERIVYKWNGIELYNIKKVDWSYLGHEVEANWKDPKENFKEKLGRFYLKDLSPQPSNKGGEV